MKKEQVMKGICPDGWEDCMAVKLRELENQLDLEIESQQKWGNEDVLSIESFRKIARHILTT